MENQKKNANCFGGRDGGRKSDPINGFGLSYQNGASIQGDHLVERNIRRLESLVLFWVLGEGEQTHTEKSESQRKSSPRFLLF